MWNDNVSKSDFIDYSHLVNAIIQIIDNKELLPCSIGVFGDWGSGKSSLMKMVESHYSDNNNVLAIHFNGWLFEGYEDTKTVLLSKIVEEIISNRKLEEKAFKAAAKLLKKVDLIKLSGSAIKHGAGYLLMGPAGLALTTSAEAVQALNEKNYEDFIKQESENPDNKYRKNIQEFHENLETLIKETNLDRIIVFIDDLDRCSFDTVIGTLEAIKLFLFAERTAFLIGADERLIEQAVRGRFPQISGENAEVGRDYLEKLIQYPIRIPPLNDQEITTYINLLFAKLYLDVGEFEYVRESVLSEKIKDQHGFVFRLENAHEFVNTVPEELKEALLMSSQLISLLTSGLNGNPRQTKRFLNTLLLRYEMAKSKGQVLNKRILAKLMLLEYFKGETFKKFYESQVENDGIIPFLNVLETSLDETSEIKEDELIIPEKDYLTDTWIKKWLKLEPPIGRENLQSYFYFSRDKLSFSGLNISRLTPKAMAVFKRILSDSVAISTNGIKACSNLSTSESSAIFDSLSDKMKHEGNQKGENPTIKKIIDFCLVRTELISQLFELLKTIPHNILPISITSWIKLVSGDHPDFENQERRILNEWSKSSKNKHLAKMAGTMLKNK